MRDARSTIGGTGDRRQRRRTSRRGFTLVELLAVIAVIGILISILIPVTGGVIKSSRKAKTKVQFAQWAAAIEGFRQEYGYYPDFGAAANPSGTEFSDGLIHTPARTRRFVQTLTGRDIDGSTLTTESPGVKSGNSKRITFASFGAGDLTPGASPQLQDAFGSWQIVVRMDKNFDGIISNDPVDGSVPAPLNGFECPTGVHAGVIFYSAGAGESEADIVKSWE